MAKGTGSKPKGKKLKNSKTDGFGAKKAVCNEVVHFSRAALNERPEREARWGPASASASGRNPDSRNPQAFPGVACFLEFFPRLQTESRTFGLCVNPVAGIQLAKKILLLPPEEIMIAFIWADWDNRDAPDKPAPTQRGAALWNQGGGVAPAWNILAPALARTEQNALALNSQAAGAVLPSER